MLRSSLTATLIGALMLFAPAGATELGLAEAMAKARTSAHEVIAARARTEAGTARLRQARGHRLPQISVDEIWVTTDNPAEVFALQLNQERFAFEDFVRGDPNRPDRLDNATTRLGLTLPLYTGGQLSGIIDQAALAAEAAEIEALWAEHRAAHAAAEAYIRLAQVRENATLLERVLETVGAHVDIARSYLAQGMIVRSEVLRAEVEASRIADLLRTARGQERVAEAHLSLRLAVDTATRWQLEPLGQPLPLNRELDDWLSLADRRPDIEAARRMLDGAALEIKVKRSALLPKIGLAARYELYDDTPFGTHGSSGAVVAMASIEVFDGFRHRAAKAAAEAELAAGEQQLAQLTDSARLEVRSAYEQAASARERLRTATAALEAAAEVERITNERFRQGVARMIDLLDATTARQEAQTRELVARAEAHLGAFNLALKSGQRPESVLAGAPGTQTRSDS